MMKSIAAIFFTFILLASCKEKKKQENSLSQKFNNNNSIPNTRLLIDYRDSTNLHFVFDNQRDTFQNILNGYVYQFQLNGIAYRAWHAKNMDINYRVMDDNDICIVVEKLMIQKWKLNIAPVFPVGQLPHGIKLNDVNLDGFNDFSFVMHGQINVIFFNENTQQLDTPVSGSFINLPYNIIDSSKKVFYEIFDVSSGVSDHVSILQTFRGKEIIPYYKLTMISSDDSGKLNRRILLYKRNKRLDKRNRYIWDEVQQLPPNGEFYSIDSIPYWRKNYKRLLKEY